MSSDEASPELLFLRVKTASGNGTATFQWIKGLWLCMKAEVDLSKGPYGFNLDFLVGLTLPQAMHQTKDCGWTRCLCTEKDQLPQG